MRQLARKRWYGIGAAIFIAGVVTGILVPSPISLEDSVPHPAAEHPMLATGGSVLRGTWTYQEDVQPSDISKVIRAMEGPTDIDNQ